MRYGYQSYSMETGKLHYLENVIEKYSDKEPFTWKDLKNLDLQDDDIIIMQLVEGSRSEGDFYDGYYCLEVSREMVETDEQYKERMEYREKQIEQSKKERYERYLKMKAEFEPNDSI